MIGYPEEGAAAQTGRPFSFRSVMCRQSIVIAGIWISIMDDMSIVLYGPCRDRISLGLLFMLAYEEQYTRRVYLPKTMYVASLLIRWHCWIAAASPRRFPT